MPEPTNTPTNADDKGTGPLSIAEASAAVERLLNRPAVDQAPKNVPAPRASAPPKEAASLLDEEDDKGALDDADDDDDTSESLLDDDDAAAPEGDRAAVATTDDDDEGDEELTVRTKRGKELSFKESDIKGALRRADYTRKTTEAAEIRRQAEARLAEYTTKAAEAAALLEQQAKAEETSIPPEPDAEMEAIDPGAWSAAWTKRRNAIDRVLALRANRQTLVTEAIKQQQAVSNEQLQGERAKLNGKEPKWADEKRFQRDGALIRRGIAKHYGVPEEQTNSIRNHESILIMRDALRYRELKAKGDSIKPDTDAVTPTLRPGGKAVRVEPAVRKVREAEARLAKSGSVEDAAALLDLSRGLLAPRKRR